MNKITIRQAARFLAVSNLAMESLADPQNNTHWKPTSGEEIDIGFDRARNRSDSAELDTAFLVESDAFYLELKKKDKNFKYWKQQLHKELGVEMV